jgi:hypothetical protein
MLQEPKYETGQIINRASGEVIPQDEPVMIFRARDVYSIDVLKAYHDMVIDEDHRVAIELRIQQFTQFKEQNPDRMKYPDTDVKTNAEDWVL